MANYLRSQGCNHTCETILTMVNTVYEEHNQLPKCLAVQADNARTNKGWLVLGFLGVYVLNMAYLRKPASGSAWRTMPTTSTMLSKAYVQQFAA